ncbi:MAG: beta-galactosidase [Candidatus Komeilibacteria bacterium]|nr:beta-galactosidase [Candidatus Komeilibacteria bacterium]
MEDGKKIWRISLLIMLVVFGYLLFFVKKPSLNNPEWGVTFSPMQANDLGLSWPEVLTGVLDDLGVRHFRLTAPWNSIEPNAGQFDFAALDWQMDEVAKRGGRVILAIGEKTPRWPECHFTEWMWKLGTTDRQAKILAMLKVVVDRYKDHPALDRWQVENERMLPFGICPRASFGFLRQELKEVRQLDPKHEVMTSDSGELSSWLRSAAISDVLPISMYRTVWNKYLGYFVWPLTPTIYFYHANLLSFLVPKVIVSELQAEPWSDRALTQTSLEIQAKSMNPEIFQKNIIFARETGFSEIYLWGAEWWYWMKEKNNQPDYWQEAKKLFQL